MITCSDIVFGNFKEYYKHNEYVWTFLKWIFLLRIMFLHYVLFTWE